MSAIDGKKTSPTRPPRKLEPMRLVVWVIAAVVVLLGAAWLLWPEAEPGVIPDRDTEQVGPRVSRDRDAESVKPAPRADRDAEPVGSRVPRDREEPASPAVESDDDKLEQLVDAFDNLTDEWREPSANGVSEQAISRFREQFNQVPKERKNECLHRALNLIPDENIMLLAGILFDKSQDRELLELVYNDILNRSETVKMPILRQVFKDMKHPCWADTAWIFDVTAEKPVAVKSP